MKKDKYIKKIGDTYYPVTYIDNGLVLIDYPDFIQKKPVDKEKINELRNKYNIKIF